MPKQQKNKNRNKEVVTVRATTKNRNTEPELPQTSTPAHAGDWICNGDPKNYADKIWGDKPIVFGRPKATEKYTVIDLEKRGLVGIYFDRSSKALVGATSENV